MAIRAWFCPYTSHDAALGHTSPLLVGLSNDTVACTHDHPDGPRDCVAVDTPETRPEDYPHTCDDGTVVNSTQAFLDHIEAIYAPAAVEAEALETYRARKQTELALAVEAYIDATVPAHRRLTLLFLMADADIEGKANRRAHVKATGNWIRDVLTDYVTRSRSIEAAATKADIDAVSADFGGNDAAKPATVADVGNTLDIVD